MNRKKGRDATVDINDSNKGDPVKILIIQIAAFSWATTHVPEITAAIQSLLNAGFLSAAQVEFIFMDEVFIPLQRRRGSGVSGILFLKMLLLATVVKKIHSLVKRGHCLPVWNT